MSGSLVVELCYDDRPVVDYAGLLGEVRRVHPDAELASTRAGSPFLIGFRSLVHRFSDGAACLIVSVLKPDGGSDTRSPRDLSQTWTWPEAATTLARTAHTLLIADVMGWLYAPKPRVAAFRAVVNALIAQTQPIGTWWPVSNRAVPPQAATEAPLGGLVNVRLFNDANRPGYLFMDTVGLHALGLPDAQIHFHDLEERRVAGLLFDLAEYIFDGAEIKSGHTVPGIHAGQRWAVSRQAARLDPERLVLDLNPNDGHA